MTKGIKITIYSVLGVAALGGGYLLYKKIKANNDAKKLASTPPATQNVPLPASTIGTPITEPISTVFQEPIKLTKGTKNLPSLSFATAPSPNTGAASSFNGGDFNSAIRSQYSRPTWVV